MSALSVIADPGDDLAWQEELEQGVEELLHALCIERRSALVQCPRAEDLERLAPLLWAGLRRAPHVRWEALRPTSSEALMARFNDLVASMPMHDATQPPSAGSDTKIWVMQLTRQLDWPEVRLLVNLVQGFPGTGVRLLLLCSRDAASSQSARLAATLGSRLYRWWCVPTQGPSRAVAPAQAVAPPRASSRESAPDSNTKAICHAALASIKALISRLRPRWDRLATLADRRPGLWWWGVGGLLVSLGGAVATWWHTRVDGAAAVDSPMRRPVPEIVELLEDARPQAVRQDRRS